MEWIEKHSVFIVLVITALGWFAQFIAARNQLKSLVQWQGDVDKRLKSIDEEINQIKISDARERIRTDIATEDISHIKRRLDDFHETFIIALSGGTIKFNNRKQGE